MQILENMASLIGTEKRELDAVSEALQELGREEKELKKSINALKRQKDRTKKQHKRLATFLDAMKNLAEAFKSDDPTVYLKGLNKLRSMISKDRRLKSELGDIEELETKAAHLKMSVSAQIRTLCETERLIPVEGDEASGFKIRGIYTVNIKWGSVYTYVGTTVGKYRRKIYSVDPQQILDAVESVREEIEKAVPEPEEFLTHLYDAYQRKVDNIGQDASLSQIQELMGLETEVFSMAIAKLISSPDLLVLRGVDVNFSSGHGGIAVYDQNGGFRTYKFVRIRKRG